MCIYITFVQNCGSDSIAAVAARPGGTPPAPIQ